MVSALLAPLLFGLAHLHHLRELLVHQQVSLAHALPMVRPASLQDSTLWSCLPGLTSMLPQAQAAHVLFVSLCSLLFVLCTSAHPGELQLHSLLTGFLAMSACDAAALAAGGRAVCVHHSLRLACCLDAAAHRVHSLGGGCARRLQPFRLS